MFNLFRIVGGIGIGFSSDLAPMYIAEIAPADRRGRLVLMYQLAITLGVMLGSSFALLMASYLPAETSWRWMFGSEVLPIVLFVIFLTMVPKSPRWLSEKGRYQDALAVLTKINGPQRAEAELTEIKQSIEEESGTFADVFSPGLRIALLVAVCLAFLNNWTGWSCVAYYMPILFQKAGFLSPQDAIAQSVTLMVLNTALTFVAIALVDRWGRKSLWVTGSMAMIVSTIAMAGIFQYASGYVVVAGVLLVLIPHAVALGPLPWLMISELFPNRIRVRAVSIATTCVWIAGFTGSQFFPMIFEAFEGQGIPGATFLVFTGICVFSLIFGVMLLPETKNRSLEEIAASWHKST